MSIQDPICTAYVHSLVYFVHTQCRYNIDSMYIVYFSTYRQEAHKNEVKAFSKHHSFFHAAVFYDMFSKKYFRWLFDMTPTLNQTCILHGLPPLSLNFREETQVYQKSCINNLTTYVGSQVEGLVKGLLKVKNSSLFNKKVQSQNAIV